MNKIWLHSVRVYIKIGLFFYYKKIDVFNAENIPKNKPLLLLSNHQNALLDALIIGTKSGRFPYFLTRSSVFEKPLVGKILRSLQMLPVYRIRDGWSTINNNKAIFEACSVILNNNEMVAVFPEGNHNLKRTVRPLSKGFTRIVFDTLDAYPDIDLQLIPVGLNYQNAVQFGDSASLYFGETIRAKDYASDKRNESVINLKSKIHSEISKLTVHILSDTYKETIMKLNDLNVSFTKPKAIHDFIENRGASSKINTHKKPGLLKKGLKFLLICNLVLPYLVWKFITQPKVKDAEFVGTFRFTIAITLVPIWLLMIFLIVLITLGWQIALGYISGSLFLALLAVKA